MYSQPDAHEGAKNAAANFPSKVEPLFTELRNELKAWLDDFMLHNTSEAGLVAGLRVMFKICREKNLKFGIAKSHLYILQVHWCGSGEGVKFDPRNISGLQGMDMPKTAGELC